MSSRRVDHEYTEQILPLIAANLPGSGLLVDVGCGEGQVPAWRPS